VLKTGTVFLLPISGYRKPVRLSLA